ncbi:hypothetical protein NADFUDRAFT_41383 [Nadsonia fulvescens var. elongata DSM 6958]|uniref:Uncharacterized protein n=1 Tax=Nadsonia fulvescens var. elongata DSM 6958 TaxID=857566 RepID=A0A1E3PN89_9ASCO|nr:hypothetical protein NADFUDRAFT_41383 [Nadsonia fulvescens var. elongata DSM 6958]
MALNSPQVLDQPPPKSAIISVLVLLTSLSFVGIILRVVVTGLEFFQKLTLNFFFGSLTTDPINTVNSPLMTSALDVLVSMATDLSLSPVQISYYRDALNQYDANLYNPQTVATISSCLERLGMAHQRPSDASHQIEFQFKLFQDILTQCLPSPSLSQPAIKLAKPEQKETQKLLIIFVLGGLVARYGLVIWSIIWSKVLTGRISHWRSELWIRVLKGYENFYEMAQIAACDIPRDLIYKSRTYAQEYILALWRARNQVDQESPIIVEPKSRTPSRGRSRNSSKEKVQSYPQLYRYRAATTLTCPTSSNPYRNSRYNIARMDMTKNSLQSFTSSYGRNLPMVFNNNNDSNEKASNNVLVNPPKKLIVQLGERQFDLNTHEGKEKWNQLAKNTKMETSTKEPKTENRVLPKKVYSSSLPLQPKTQSTNNGSNIIIEHAPSPPVSSLGDENNQTPKLFKPKIRNFFEDAQVLDMEKVEPILTKTKSSSAISSPTTPTKKPADERWWKADRGVMASTAGAYNPFMPYRKEAAPLRTSTPLKPELRGPLQPQSSSTSQALSPEPVCVSAPPNKAYRRIFIPGRGWRSAKSLAEEKGSNKPVNRV